MSHIILELNNIVPCSYVLWTRWEHIKWTYGRDMAKYLFHFSLMVIKAIDINWSHLFTPGYCDNINNCITYWPAAHSAILGEKNVPIKSDTCAWTGLKNALIRWAYTKKKKLTSPFWDMAILTCFFGNPEELISVSTLFNPKYEESGVIFLIMVPIWLKIC